MLCPLVFIGPLISCVRRIMRWTQRAGHWGRARPKHETDWPYGCCLLAACRTAFGSRPD
jgi:hypothetical protein